jgi:outer membrane murein-binding lipoprotein Lpp
MSGSWCMWCMAHPNDWKLHPLPDTEHWTMQKIKERKEQLDAGLLKEPSSIRGVVNYPIWDFIEPSHMVFPQLHVEIGLVNNVLDSFYLFIDDQVEAPTEEEKYSRNTYIIADVALVKAVEQLDEWKNLEGHNLQGYRDQAAELRRSLKRPGAMNQIEIDAARTELEELDQEIQRLVQERKAMESDIKTRRAALQEAKKKLQSVRAKKKKIDLPIFLKLRTY